ncbi:MAG: cytochrome ubiquinol oxidase subunit I, partial [Limosilactobacillus fermentum]
DPKTHKTEASIDIPDMLSLLTYGKTTGSVTGMKEINAQLEKKYGTKIGGQKVSYYVPVNTLFWSFRVMVGFGSLLFLVSLCGLIATRRGRTAMYEKRWVMWLFGLLTFSPFLANTTGWMITEFGRYPWTVYGLFTIAQSVSPNVSVTSLLISNIVYFLLFTGLAAVMIALICRELRHDPNEVEEGQLEKLTADPFAKGAF